MTSRNIRFSVFTAVLTLMAVFAPIKTYAACTPLYGGGENCTYDRKFKIEKFVKLEGDSSWSDEVNINLNDGDEADKKILFKVLVTNTSESGANLADDMTMKDKWPDEIKFLSSKSADQKEEWDDFAPGEKKEFIFWGELEDDIKDEDGNFSDCTLNKAELYYSGDLAGSSTASVCWSKEGDVLGITTLPKTGESSLILLAGILTTLAGVVLGRSKNFR